ncbi:hypothetical protein Tco_0682653 [Tanacetum coccineum]|uniref:Uncharacterized protein n=1 Tax=Tanacetum coccineum TaxID=301880 RepID=A0ABQ4XTP6_9ASTR
MTTRYRCGVWGAWWGGLVHRWVAIGVVGWWRECGTWWRSFHVSGVDVENVWGRSLLCSGVSLGDGGGEDRDSVCGIVGWWWTLGTEEKLAVVTGAELSGWCVKRRICRRGGYRGMMWCEIVRNWGGESD